MSGEEEWPCLGRPPANTAASDGDWELLATDDTAGPSEPSNQDVEVVMVPPPHPMVRRSSVSAPDLRALDDDDNQTGVESSVVMVSNPPSVAETSSVVVVPNVWGTKNKVSFKDAILSPSKHVPAAASTAAPQKPRVKNKVKSRYVVTPIKRCAKSTGDLLSLVENEDEEAMGESDAMEYYNRKAHGAHGRSNGMKIRPDEAKRKEMIVEKKNMQRQRQGKK